MRRRAGIHHGFSTMRGRIAASLGLGLALLAGAAAASPRGREPPACRGPLHRLRGPDRGGGRAGRARPRLRAAGAPRRGALPDDPAAAEAARAWLAGFAGRTLATREAAGARPLGPNRPGRRHTGWGAADLAGGLVAAGLVAVDAGRATACADPACWRWRTRPAAGGRGSGRRHPRCRPRRWRGSRRWWADSRSWRGGCATSASASAAPTSTSPLSVRKVLRSRCRNALGGSCSNVVSLPRGASGAARAGSRHRRAVARADPGYRRGRDDRDAGRGAGAAALIAMGWSFTRTRARPGARPSCQAAAIVRRRRSCRRRSWRWLSRRLHVGHRPARWPRWRPSCP